MSDIEKIQELVNILPTLVVYLVPGYIVLWVNSFALARKLNNDNHLVLKSIVLSYIMIAIANLILGYWKLDVFSSNYIKIGIVLIAAALGLILSRILLSIRFKNFLNWIGINSSVHEDLWNEISDNKLGFWVIAYVACEQVFYRGKVRKYIEKKDAESSFFVISNYTSYSDEGVVYRDFSDRNDIRLLINTKDTSSIELFYDPESHIIL